MTLLPGKTTAPLTQRDRVLRQLERTGHVSPEDFLLPDVCDGLAPILRVAPRIGELRDQGLPIVTGTTRHGTALYVLQHPEPTDDQIYNGPGMEGGIAYRGAA